MCKMQSIDYKDLPAGTVPCLKGSDKDCLICQMIKDMPQTHRDVLVLAKQNPETKKMQVWTESEGWQNTKEVDVPVKTFANRQEGINFMFKNNIKQGNIVLGLVPIEKKEEDNAT